MPKPRGKYIKRPPLTTEQQQLVTSNVRLVWWALGNLVRGVRKDSQQWECLQSECMIALCEAAITFEPWREVPFAAHARWHFRNRISRYFGSLNVGKRLGEQQEVNLSALEDRHERDERTFADPKSDLAIAAVDTADELAWCRRHVTDREWHALTKELRGDTLNDLAEVLGVCRERARQIGCVAMQKIRNRLEDSL